MNIKEMVNQGIASFQEDKKIEITRHIELISNTGIQEIFEYFADQFNLPENKRDEGTTILRNSALAIYGNILRRTETFGFRYGFGDHDDYVKFSVNQSDTGVVTLEGDASHSHHDKSALLVALIVDHKTPGSSTSNPSMIIIRKDKFIMGIREGLSLSIPITTTPSQQEIVSKLLPFMIK